MKFGKVEIPYLVDFTLPADHPATANVLPGAKSDEFNVYVGCARWSKSDLKGFYPRGTKDELTYYSTQFNSIELNATYYTQPSDGQVIRWRDKTPADFRFFPKITNSISHYRRLLNVNQLTDAFCDAVIHFEEKLGTVFLQLNNQFSPREFTKLAAFVEYFPKSIPLAVEVRNEQWFSDPQTWDEFCSLLQSNNVTNLITDTAGRRDLLHQRLTTSSAFIRFTGSNIYEIDYLRMDEWLERIGKWQKKRTEKPVLFHSSKHGSLLSFPGILFHRKSQFDVWKIHACSGKVGKNTQIKVLFFFVVINKKISLSL